MARITVLTLKLLDVIDTWGFSLIMKLLSNPMWNSY